MRYVGQNEVPDLENILDGPEDEKMDFNEGAD
jgi:hypothetical protein